MKNARSIGTLIPVIAFTASGFARAATHVDGRIPVYPSAVPRGFSWSNQKTATLMKAGIPMFADSADSVSTVSDWYRQQLPKSCAKTTQSIGIHYECSIGVVNVLTKDGKTMIVIVPR